MKKALVTGGAGYIGHHLQKELKKNGYYVIVMDQKHPSQLMVTKYCDEYIHTDIRNYDHILDEIEYGKMFDDDKFSFDVVFHLSGLIEVSESEEQPIRYYENNVSGTINILRLMKDYGCDKIIFSSSAAAADPVSVYGNSKKMCENILRDSKKEGIYSVSLRYFNVAGADLDGEFGESHDPESHLIPNIFNWDDFTINGNDFPTHDGTCVRDYIHVSDLAEAHIRAAELLFRQNENENKSSFLFDVGSGTGYSILDVLKMVEKVTGTKIDIKYGPRRPGDPAKLVCDTYWAKEILKFEPKYNIEKIIESAYQWEVIQRRQPNDSIGIRFREQESNSV